MNNLYIIMAAFAVISGASVASDHKKTSEHKSETFEFLGEGHVDEVAASRAAQQRTEMEEESQENLEELKRADTLNLADEERMNLNQQYVAERTEQRSWLMQFVRNLRMASPELVFTTLMGGLTLNEATDPRPSLIAMSAMTLLGGYCTVKMILSGQRESYNFIPDTAQDGLRIVLSAVPGLIYYLRDCMTMQEVPEEIKLRVEHCVRRCLGVEK